MATKRLMRELAEMKTPEVAAADLFYEPDEVDTRRGTGLLVGPKDTPYAYCPLTFSFRLPATYPFEPPSVLIQTSNGITRFHPNLYVGGKVCLSILGTWTGPAWSAVMTIRTVMTSILGLLDDNPIANEPGYANRTKEDPFSKNYSAVVQYMLAAHTFPKLLAWRSNGVLDPEWAPFKDVFAERDETWLQGLWGVICAEAATEAATGGKRAYGAAYGMNCVVDWGALKAKGLSALSTLSANGPKA